jgi:hypothetical protein
MKNRNIDHKNDWKTPNSIFEFIEKKFWIKKQDLFDPCPFQHDMSWNWLEIEWRKYNFINPPYSLDLKTAFVKKAIEERKKGHNCIMLLPVSTSTKLFHDYILPNKDLIIFLKGRVKFSWWNTKWEWVDNKCWMHDSMIVVF